MKSTHIILAFGIGLLLASPLLAQETITTPAPVPQETIEKTDYEQTYQTRSVTFGAFAGYSLDFHSADQLTLPNVPTCCDGYDGGTGGGVFLGISMNFPIASNLDLLGRLSYHGSSVTMTSEEPITVRQGNTAVPASITHELTASLGTLGTLDAGLIYRISPAFRALAGIRTGLILSSTYEQREVLDPDIAYDYDGGAAIRNESSGDITDVSAFQLGMFVGLQYALNLDRSETLHLIPEVQFAPMFTNIVSGEQWSMSSVRFMLNFTQTLFSVEKRSTPLKP